MNRFNSWVLSWLVLAGIGLWSSAGALAAADRDACAMLHKVAPQNRTSKTYHACKSYHRAVEGWKWLRAILNPPKVALDFSGLIASAAI
jgi:hypothetical protein